MSIYINHCIASDHKSICSDSLCLSSDRLCDTCSVSFEINNKIYLYEMLTTNLLQAMLVRRAEQSHQHWQSSNSALFMHWAHTQSKSETITTRSLMRWSLHIHRRTATSLHTCCNSYTTYTYILRRHDSAFAHIQTDVMQ